MQPEKYIPQIWSETFLTKIKTRTFGTKTLEEKIVEQFTKLKKLGLEDEKITKLFTKIKEEAPNYKCFNEILDHLTKFLPKKASPLFVYNRMDVAFDCQKFNKDSFKLFNKAFAKYRDTENFDLDELSASVFFSTDRYNDKVEKKKQSFLLSKHNTLPLETINSFLNELTPESLKSLEDILRVGHKLDYKMLSPFLDAKEECFLAFYELCKNYPQADTNRLAKLALGCVDNDNNFSQYLFNVVFTNIDNKYMTEALEHCKTNDGTKLHEGRLHYYYNLRNNGWKEEEIDPSIIREDANVYGVYNFIEKTLRVAKKYSDIDKDAIISICHAALFLPNKDTEEILVNLIKKAKENKLTIGANYNGADDSFMTELITRNPIGAVRTYNILGEKILTEMFRTKDYLEIAELIDFFGNINLDEEFIPPQELLNAINPNVSIAEIDKDIKALKRKLMKTNKHNQKALIKKINDSTFYKNSLIKNSIKDPKEALDIAIIYKTLYDLNPVLVKQIQPYLKNKTAEEYKEFYKVLNKLVFNVLGIDNNIVPLIQSKIDLSNSKYLPNVFKHQGDFAKNLNSLISEISKYPELSTEQALNKLTCNIKTKELLESFDLNYKTWSHFDQNFNMKFMFKISTASLQQSVLRNFENDLNDDIFMSLPIKERNRIFKRIKELGYELKKVEKPIYNENGYLQNTIKQNNVLKKSLPINIEDLKIILNVIRKEFSENPYWTSKESLDSDVIPAKEVFKNHILKQRNIELRRAFDKKLEKVHNITIQNIDMNNIPKALFIGDESGCCTASDGINGWAAPNYIRNKLVSGIEILDENIPIGNTMIYLAKIDNEPSLLIDNIELKNTYQYNEDICQGIIKYAKFLCEKLGKPNMKIYAGANRHKVDLSNYPILKKEFNLLGFSDSSIYLDFCSEQAKINPKKEFNAYLHKIG